MRNTLIVKNLKTNENTISVSYTVEGEWQELFLSNKYAEMVYNLNVSRVPLGVAIIPFLSNILPVSWVCDATVVVPECDKDFYDCIKVVKEGYKEMYPMISFGGELVALEVSDNKKDGTGVMALFSGGVDAFNTLVTHADEHPTLFSIWGADVLLSDEIGWNRIEKHIKLVAKVFDTDCCVVKSSFRSIVDEFSLGEIIKSSGDGWWHGFQHGIGLIGHAAPVAYVLQKRTVYIASSFTAAEKGKVTCASDPSIDNHIRFCGTRIVHDGYEINRQAKIHNIVQFSKKKKISIPLRVCWESEGGNNCCTCEKCWRTMLGLFAEGVSAKDYGFEWKYKELWKTSIRMHYGSHPAFGSLRYRQIQEAMHQNIQAKNLPLPMKWFFDYDLNKAESTVFWYSFARKLKEKFKR